MTIPVALVLVLADALSGPAQPGPPPPTPTPTPTLEDVLVRAAEYVVRFERVISSVVAEEHYRQRLLLYQSQAPGLRGRPSEDVQRTELKSDFLMVRSRDTDMWIPFRDVFEVNGEPVRAREERLTKLLLDESGSAYDRAWRLTEEGARYNLGPVQRTVNVPTQALQFLLPSNQPKSVFRRAGVERIGAVSAWEIRFEEIGVPTLIRTTGGASLPASGTFWIDPATGAVLRTMVRTRQSTFRSEIVVTFEPHEQLDVRLPAELKEKYLGTGYELDGTATYSRFKKFRVTTDEVVK
jgi:hypothetical protein